MEPLCFLLRLKEALCLEGHCSSAVTLVPGSPRPRPPVKAAPSKSDFLQCTAGGGVLRQIDWIFFFLASFCRSQRLSSFYSEVHGMGIEPSWYAVFTAFLLLVCSSQMKTPRLFCSCRPAAFLLYHGSDYVTLGPQVKFRPLTLT